MSTVVIFVHGDCYRHYRVIWLSNSNNSFFTTKNQKFLKENKMNATYTINKNVSNVFFVDFWGT